MKLLARAFTIGVGSAIALGLLAVLLSTVDYVAKEIATDPTSGIGRLIEIAVILAAAAFVVLMFAGLAFELLDGVKPRPKERRLLAWIEWLGAATLGGLAQLVAMGGALAIAGMALVAGLAAVWAVVYGSAWSASHAFGVSFGWGLAIGLGVLFLLCSVGGGVYGWVKAGKEHDQQQLPHPGVIE